MDKIPVYNQIVTEDDAVAAYNAVKSGMLSHAGEYVQKLEESFSNRFNRIAISCSSGTAALHLALLALNLNNASIAVPAGVFASVGFAVEYVNGDIEFVDLDKSSWNMDLNLLEKLCRRKKIDAVIAVHNYSNLYDYDKLLELSHKYKFYIIEDACEAIGSTYKDKQAGQLGDISVFSLFGNKTITSGEGGIILTDDKVVADRIRSLKCQSIDSLSRFMHTEIGYNYRMTNIQAAIALSQFSRLDRNVERSREIDYMYRNNLYYLHFYEVINGCKPSCWMTAAHMDCINVSALISRLIPIRPMFGSMPDMEPWKYKNVKCPISTELRSIGFVLPSGPGLNDDTIYKICEKINEVAQEHDPYIYG
jgi:perosamine synthetase